MNIFTFTGRIGKDAETRTTQNGTSVTSFSVANDVGWGDNKKTLWIDCTLWKERGEKLCQYLKKGTPVTVSGEATVRAYTKDGEARGVIQVSVRDIELQGGKQEQASTGQGPAPAESNDDIPF